MIKLPATQPYDYEAWYRDVQHWLLKSYATVVRSEATWRTHYAAGTTAKRAAEMEINHQRAKGG